MNAQNIAKVRMSDGMWGKVRHKGQEVVEAGTEKCEQDLDCWREMGAFRLWGKRSGGRQDLDHQIRETGRRLKWDMEGSKAS